MANATHPLDLASYGIHDVADIDFFALQTHRVDDFDEELSCFANKWYSLIFFVRAGGFAAKEYGGVDVTVAENDLLSGVEVLVAYGAVDYALAEPFPACALVAFW